MSITVIYNTGLSPASLYISQAQLKSDVQSFVAAYSSPQDPVEAIASSVLASILQKYPQINGGYLGLQQVTSSPVTVSLINVSMGTLGPTSSRADRAPQLK